MVLGSLLLIESVSLPASASFYNSPVFLTAKNLSNDTGVAVKPAVSNNGQNVYVAWSEGKKGIFFRMSPDGGITWNPPLNKPGLVISPAGGSAQYPVAFTQYQRVPSGVVYVAWAQSVRQANRSLVLQIFVATSTNNGLTFTATQVSHNTSNAQIGPSLGAEGSHVYVAWFSEANYTNDGGIYASASKDNGTTWTHPVDVVNPSSNGEVQFVASGGNAYLTADGIWFAATYNNGTTWNAPIKLFSTPIHSQTSIYYGREPWIAANKTNVYVIWEANSTQAGIGYHDQGVTSINGGKTWGSIQNLTEPLIQTGSRKTQRSGTMFS